MSNLIDRLRSPIRYPGIEDEAAARIEYLENAVKAIKRATINVCDDVAWFDQLETLHDFCDRILAAAGGVR